MRQGGWFDLRNNGGGDGSGGGVPAFGEMEYGISFSGLSDEVQVDTSGEYVDGRYHRDWGSGNYVEIWFDGGWKAKYANDSSGFGYTEWALVGGGSFDSKPVGSSASEWVQVDGTPEPDWLWVVYP